MVSAHPVAIDPRTKLLFCLLINIAIFSYVSQVFLLLFVLLACVLLLLYREHRIVIKFVLVYFIVIGFDYLAPHLPRTVVAILGAPASMFKIFMPFIIYGILLIRTTEISDVANVLDKMHTPDAVLIPLLVVFRFFPTVREEARHISHAMKLRGLGFGPGSLITKPVKTVEHLYVPLLYTLVKAGEELTQASLTRGLGGMHRRSYIRDVCFHFIDWLLLFIFAALLFVSIYFGR